MTDRVPRSPAAVGRFGQMVKAEPLFILLLALPLALALELGHASPLWLFLASGVAIIPLAGLMGRATENLAETLGAGIGGLLNATFGNAAELIIALMLVIKGPEMYPLVKASLTGSIIGNVLLVLGLAILAGGLKFQRQQFNRTAAGMGTTLLALAAVGLTVPAIYFYVFQAGIAQQPEEIRRIEFLSEEIALILAGVYVLSLIFSLWTHQHLFAGPEEDLPTTGDHQPEWSRRTSLIVLIAATAGVALMSEILSDSVKEAGAALNLNAVFVGVIVVAVVGNAAEHSTAVLVAMKNKMDLSVNIAIGSSLQIALFVAPVLVFASMVIQPDHPLDLHFTVMEVVAVVLSIAVLALVSMDGETHWLEGAMLMAVYLIFALAFYHLPEAVWKYDRVGSP